MAARRRHRAHRLRTGRNRTGPGEQRLNTIPHPGQPTARPARHHLAGPRIRADRLPGQLGQRRPELAVVEGRQRTAKGQRISTRRRHHDHAQRPDARRHLQGPDAVPLLQRRPHGSRIQRPLDRRHNPAGNEPPAGGSHRPHGIPRRTQQPDPKLERPPGHEHNRVPDPARKPTPTACTPSRPTREAPATVTRTPPWSRRRPTTTQS